MPASRTTPTRPPRRKTTTARQPSPHPSASRARPRTGKASERNGFQITPPPQRLSLPGPDWQAWGAHLREYARRDPAALLVGAVAVLMALMLIL